MEEKVVDGYVVPTPVKPEDGGEKMANPAAINRAVWLDLDEALEDLRAAMPDYLTAEAYYEGTVKEKFVNKAVEKLLSGSDTDFNVNLAGRCVDAVKDRMEIAAVTAEPVDSGLDAGKNEEDDPSEDDISRDDEVDNKARDNSSNAASALFGGVEETEEEEISDEERELDEAVSKIWRDNEMDIESPEVHEKMLEYGDSYLFVGLSDDESEPDRVDLFYNSPLSVRVLYQDENPRKKRLAIKRWQVGPKNERKIRLNLYYPEGTYKFISEGSSDKGGSASYRIYTDETTDENGYVVNETGEIPFFHFRTARPYGRPEHKKAYGAQDALTKFIVNMMDNTDFSTFPQRYALKESGTTTDDDLLDWDGGDPDTADTKNPTDLESQLVAGPGRIWTLNNVKAVGQFDTADIEQFLKPMDKFTGLMAAVTATPISYFLVTISSNASASSGESQRKGESPFISKVNARQLSAEATWSDSLAYALKLKGYTAEVKVRWAPSQVVSGVDGWRAVQEQQKAGVPVRQTLLEAGYTEAEVTSWGYTKDNPDGPGLDMSDMKFPPPLPGQPMPTNLPGTEIPQTVPTPPPVETSVSPVPATQPAV